MIFLYSYPGQLLAPVRFVVCVVPRLLFCLCRGMMTSVAKVKAVAAVPLSWLSTNAPIYSNTYSAYNPYSTSMIIHLRYLLQLVYSSIWYLQAVGDAGVILTDSMILVPKSKTLQKCCVCVCEAVCGYNDDQYHCLSFSKGTPMNVFLKFLPKKIAFVCWYIKDATLSWFEILLKSKKLPLAQGICFLSNSWFKSVRILNK